MNNSKPSAKRVIPSLLIMAIIVCGIGLPLKGANIIGAATGFFVGEQNFRIEDPCAASINDENGEVTVTGCLRQYSFEESIQAVPIRFRIDFGLKDDRHSVEKDGPNLILRGKTCTVLLTTNNGARIEATSSLTPICEELKTVKNFNIIADFMFNSFERTGVDRAGRGIFSGEIIGIGMH